MPCDLAWQLLTWTQNSCGSVLIFCVEVENASAIIVDLQVTFRRLAEHLTLKGEWENVIFLVLCVNKFLGHLDSVPYDFTCMWFLPPVPGLLVLIIVRHI